MRMSLPLKIVSQRAFSSSDIDMVKRKETVK